MAPATSYASRALELMDEIEARSDPAHIRTALSGFLGEFGIDRFTLTRLPLPRDRIAPSMIVSAWPADFLRHYDAQRFYRDDPIADRVFNSVAPFLWSDVRVDAVRSPRAAAVMASAAEAGMREGLCIPVHDVNGFQGSVSMAGERIVLPPQGLRAIRMLTLVAFGVADRPPRHAEPSRSLSPREREVLQFLATGLTANEVGARLGISDSTIAVLLARARTKLGTLNTVHTVVEALRHREIDL